MTTAGALVLTSRLVGSDPGRSRMTGKPEVALERLISVLRKRRVSASRRYRAKSQYCGLQNHCNCLSVGKRFAHWSLTVRFLMFGVVTPVGL